VSSFENCLGCRGYGDGEPMTARIPKTRKAIRTHLTHIVAMFSNGVFSIPMFVHDQVPPGVSVMRDKHAEISYSFEELPTGGRVRIKTANADALKTIHDFLRFQIEDHHTEDAIDVGSS
jgi:hypothetical protein